MLFADFRRWLNRGAQNSKQVRKPAAARRFRPTIESLEDRLAPAVLTVNTLLDTTYSGTYLSLRDAIATVDFGSTYALSGAEASQVSGTLGQNDTIVFAAGLTGTITLTSSLTQIGANVQILGPGPSQLTINGAKSFQIFYVSTSDPAAARVSIAGLTLENGYAVNGGAIQVGGADEDALDGTNVSVSDCTIVGNQATDGVSGGGAIAIYFVNLTATHCVFTDNSAPVGGAITNDGGTMELSNDSFTDNDGSAAGGAISMIYPSALTAVQNSVFTDNSAASGEGGAIDSLNSSLVLTNDSFTDNTATSGGAISNGGPLTVTACTFAGNSALYDNGGAIDANGPAVIVDSTFAGNTCGFSGGGVCAEASTTLQLTNDTFWGNDAENGNGSGVDVEGPITNGSDVVVEPGALATLDNTIVAGNYSEDNGFTDIGGFGTVNANSANNLIGYAYEAGGLTNNVNGNLVGVAPALLPLGNYGGPTETMPPAAGSPAIGAGTLAFVASSETDQRGFSRTTGGAVDIGAVEVQPGGVATHLELQGPATVTAGVPMSWIAVALDDNGLPASTAFGPVVMSVASGPASFTASSTTLTDAVYGTADFSNLTLDASGYYTLQASFGNSSITAPLVVNPAAPVFVAATSGGGQKVQVGGNFANPLVVTVADQFGNPVPSVPIAFATPISGASAVFSNGGTDIAGTTNASGQVSETLTANTVAGSYTVTTTALGGMLEADFTLTNDLPATQVLLVGSATQSVMAGDAVAPIMVKTEDKNGNPVPGTVTFKVTLAASLAGAAFAGGSPTATVPTSVVGALDEAVAPTLTANGHLGPYTVVATVPGGTKSFTFTLTNIADPVVGPSQSTVVDTKYATPLYAKVTDALGNPIAGAIVTFTAPAAGPSGTFAGRRTVTERTTAAGIATAPAFTANTKSGSFVVTVGFNGAAPPETIALTNLAGPPKHLTLFSGSSQSAALNTAFAVPLQVRVTDAFGNVVSGAEVTFTIQPNALLGATASFSGAASVTQTSNTSGLAIAPLLTAAGKRGRFTVIARIAGITSDAVFVLTVEG